MNLIYEWVVNEVETLQYNVFFILYSFRFAKKKEYNESIIGIL